MTIRWGIFGTGTAAHAAASAFKLVPDAELLAIGSRDHERAKTFASQFDASRAYEGYDCLLSDQDVDVVYIATPNYRHKQDSLRCLEAGKAVMCEKSFALNATEAEEVIDAARAKGLFCMEAMWMRFIPAVLEARRRIASGEIGKICLLKADLGYPTPFDPDHRYFSQQLGGGCLLDRGVYLVSLAHYLMGIPHSVKSCGVIGETGVDYQSSYLLKFANGGIADLTATLQTYGTNEAIIFGTKGRIRLRDPFYRSWQLTANYFAEAASSGETERSGNSGLKEALIAVLMRYPGLRQVQQRVESLAKVVSSGKTETLTYPGNGYQFEFAEATRCLQEGRLESSVMPLGDTLAVMRTMDAIRKQWTP